jgi:hypothetical protein
MEEADSYFVLRSFSNGAVYFLNEVRVWPISCKKNETRDIVVCTEILH